MARAVRNTATYLAQRQPGPAPIPDGRCHHRGGSCEAEALAGRWVCDRHARRLERIGERHQGKRAER